DDQSNKIVIGYNVMDDPEKYFIGTIALNTKNGNFQCNNIQCNEIQASNLHFHNNLSVLNSITSDHIKDIHSHNNLSVLNTITSDHIHNHSNKSYLDSINQNLSKNSHPEFDLIRIKGNLIFVHIVKSMVFRFIVII